MWIRIDPCCRSLPLPAAPAPAMGKPTRGSPQAKRPKGKRPKGKSKALKQRIIAELRRMTADRDKWKELAEARAAKPVATKVHGLLAKATRVKLQHM